MGATNLEIDLLRCFVAVADTGSFTLAGDIVGRTQSAVSQRVKRLEDMVQRQLFLRDSRALSLTRDGEILLGHARQMLTFNDATVRTSRRAANRPEFASASRTISSRITWLRMLEEFRRRHPGLEVDVQTGMSCGLNRAFDAGEIDLVFAKKDGEAQRGRVIWREPLCWIACEGFNYEDGRAPASGPSATAMRLPRCRDRHARQERPCLPHRLHG